MTVDMMRIMIMKLELPVPSNVGVLLVYGIRFIMPTNTHNIFAGFSITPTR